MINLLREFKGELIMKKLLIATLTAMMIGSTLVACGSDNSGNESGQVEVANVKTSDIATKIKEEIELRPTGPVEGQQASEMFHLNLDDVEEFTIEQGMMNSGLETIAIVKAKDGKVDAVKEALEKVKEDKKAAAFYPGEPEAVEASSVEVVGNYVALLIIPDYEEGAGNSAKANKIFKDAVAK